VFIDDVEIVECPEGFAPTSVWFETVNESRRAGAHPLDALIDLPLEFAPFIVDRKGVWSRDFSPVRSDGGADRKIERGPEVVDQVPDNGADMDRDLLSEGDLEKAVTALRVIVGRDYVWASVQKRHDLRLKIVEMALRPANL
jgi:hypothetical protein